MVTVTDAQREAFREHGYVVIPGALTQAQLERGRALIEQQFATDPPPAGHQQRWRTIITDPLHEFQPVR